MKAPNLTQPRFNHHHLTLTLCTAVLVSATACGGSGTTEANETADQAPAMAEPTFTRTHALRGPEGVRVNVAEFGEDEALFMISGSRSDLDGYALRGKVEEQNRGELRFSTTWDGRDYYPVQRHTQYGSNVWKLYGAGHRNGLTLEYDEEASNKVDTHALYEKHVAQTRDGSLAKVQTFDRAASEARHDEELAADLARVQEECGAKTTWTTHWSSVSDEILQKYSISGYCENVLSALRSLCRHEPGKKFVQANIESIECTWGDALNVSLDGKTLKWTTANDSNLSEKVYAELVKMPAGAGATLEQEIVYAKSDVCQSEDGKHVLVVHPHERENALGISYGTSKELFHSAQPYDLGRGWFFDPRQFRKQNNENFRGRDLRYYSHVKVDKEAGQCTLACGERETKWSLLDAGKARAVLTSAKSTPAPFDREPYALARDAKGVYYYVDRGNTEETRRDFHIYKGPRGRLKRLEMKDVASDSEGEVFSTNGGELRLLVEKDGAAWVQSKKTQKLNRIPVHENYRLIMKELGVYLGRRFELPCDDY